MRCTCTRHTVPCAPSPVITTRRSDIHKARHPCLFICSSGGGAILRPNASRCRVVPCIVPGQGCTPHFIGRTRVLRAGERSSEKCVRETRYREKVPMLTRVNCARTFGITLYMVRIVQSAQLVLGSFTPGGWQSNTHVPLSRLQQTQYFVNASRIAVDVSRVHKQNRSNECSKLLLDFWGPSHKHRSIVDSHQRCEWKRIRRVSENTITKMIMYPHTS